MAAFLLWRGPLSMFGASSGWSDADWRWHAQYDLAIGMPTGPATTADNVTFSRGYTRGSVSLNCSLLAATIQHTGTRG